MDSAKDAQTPVRHVGSAMVVSSESHVAPLFLAQIPNIVDVDPDVALSHQYIVPMERYLNMTASEREFPRRANTRFRMRVLRQERSSNERCQSEFFLADCEDTQDDVASPRSSHMTWSASTPQSLAFRRGRPAPPMLRKYVRVHSVSSHCDTPQVIDSLDRL